MWRSLALVMVLLGGCGAAARQPSSSITEPFGAIVRPSGPVDNDALASQTHDSACANSAEPPSIDACTTDADCRLCHDGSACGTAVTALVLSARGAECARPDGAWCESQRVRCCAGHCLYVAF